jgi:hypothetical protein
MQAATVAPRSIREAWHARARNADVSGLEITDPDLAASHYLPLDAAISRNRDVPVDLEVALVELGARPARPA